MTRNAHDEARELMALGDGVSDAQRVRLRAHLDECDACRQYAESVTVMVRALRLLPVAADSRLVQATRRRVRSRAIELRERQERMWLVGVSCVLVTISAALSTSLFWRAFEWIGGLAGVSQPVWELGFAIFWIIPALVVSGLFLALGTHMTYDGEQQWR